MSMELWCILAGVSMLGAFIGHLITGHKEPLVFILIMLVVVLPLARYAYKEEASHYA